MSEYTPKYYPSITLIYTVVEPGQKGNFNQPELAPMIELDDIIAKGKRVSRVTFGDIKKGQHWANWKEEIIEFLSAPNKRA